MNRIRNGIKFAYYILRYSCPIETMIALSIAVVACIAKTLYEYEVIHSCKFAAILGCIAILMIMGCIAEAFILEATSAKKYRYTLIYKRKLFKKTVYNIQMKSKGSIKKMYKQTGQESFCPQTEFLKEMKDVFTTIKDSGQYKIKLTTHEKVYEKLKSMFAEDNVIITKFSGQDRKVYYM